MKPVRAMLLSAMAMLALAATARADGRIGVSEYVVAPHLKAVSFLGPLDRDQCANPAFETDLRCGFAANDVGPDGAMYLAPQSFITGTVCDTLGDPCSRTTLYRRRPDESAVALMHVDERFDSNQHDQHRLTVTGVYIDPVKCSIYLLIETECTNPDGDCSLYTPANEVVKVTGLKSSKCEMPGASFTPVTLTGDMPDRPAH